MKPASIAVLVAALLAAVTIIVQTTRTDRARAAVSAATLAVDSVEASRDTTRQLTVHVKTLGDSLRLVERRAVQRDEDRDALDRALRLDRAARESLVAVIAAYQGMAQGIMQSSDSVDAGTHGSDTPVDRASVVGTRQATFDVRQAPYRVHAEVEVPAAPEVATMALDVTLDTLVLEARLECGRPNAAGVRLADVAVTGPVWASVRLARVESAASVCAGLGASAGPGKIAWVRSIASRLGVSMGYVVQGGPSGTVVAGLGVMVGIRVWP